VDEVKAGVAHGSGREAASADQAAAILVLRGVREFFRRGKRKIRRGVPEGSRDSFLEGARSRI